VAAVARRGQILCVQHLTCLLSAWTNASGKQRKALTLGWQAKSLEVAPTPDGEIWAAACVPARAAL
jgi:hypothetical protein